MINLYIGKESLSDNCTVISSKDMFIETESGTVIMPRDEK